MRSRDLAQEVQEVIGIYRSSSGGQEAMGSRDLVQEFWEVIRISGAQGVVRRLWGQGT